MIVASDKIDPLLEQLRLREFISREVARRASVMDSEQRVPRELIEACAALGFFGTQICRRYGGREYAALDTGLLCEVTGAASASMLSLFAVHTMLSLAISRWGTAEQRESWLPRLACGSALGAFALSEPEAGSDVEAVQTTLVELGTTVVVSGTKTWISFGQIADVFVVVGKLAGKITAAIVDRDTPGLEVKPIAHVLGFRAAMLAELRLDRCIVPKQNLLGSRDFGLAQVVGSVLDHGRYCIAWGCVGLAQACLEASLRYAARRSQFGRSLAEHQLVQEMLANMLVETRAARLLCAEAAKARAAGDPDMIMAAVIAKYFAAGAADRAASCATQIHGANACDSRYSVHRYLGDSKIMSIIEGTAQIQQMLIAQYAIQRA